MNKIINLLVVNRIEIKEKWWHRFHYIIVYGSIAVLILIILFFISIDSSWKKYTYTSYSFEQGFSSAKGVETNCYFYTYDYSDPSIYCGDINIPSEFMRRYTLANGTYEKYTALKSEQNLTDDKIVSGGIKSGDFSDIKVKKATSILFSNLIKQLLIGVIFISLWFIFWESIIYRCFVYIIYGK